MYSAGCCISASHSKVSQAAGTIADCVHELQLSHPNAPAIVLGDLNQCHLETVLPGFVQYVKDRTRKDNILDKCFVNVRFLCVLVLATHTKF